MTKKTTKQTKQSSVATEQKQEPTLQDFFVLGHFVKYNLYLLSKAVVFSSIASRFDNLNDAVVATNGILVGLDQGSTTPAPARPTTEAEQTH